MKKKILICAVGVMICTAMATTAFGASKYSVRIGDKLLQSKNPILMQDGRIYVSVRDMCDALGFPVEWDGGKGEAVIDIYNKKVPVSENTEFKKEGVIPDAETAYTVGKAILEKYAGEPLEYETEDRIYYLTVRADEQTGTWKVIQTFKYIDEEKGWLAGDGFKVPSVTLSKQTGEVLFINLASSFNGITESYK